MPIYEETIGPIDILRPHHIRLRFSRVWDSARLGMAQNVLNSGLDDKAKLQRLAGLFGPLSHNVEVSTVTESESVHAQSS